jgi:DNA-binding response OmpR family regulator
MRIALQLLKDPKDPKQSAVLRRSREKAKETFLPENEPMESSKAVLGATQRGILVADDDPVVLKAFEMKLKAEGFAVSTTTNAASVASLAETAKVEVIILDLQFPTGGTVEWSGFTVMQWLKRFSKLANIPVIVMTGSDSAQHRDKALTAGAAAFFQKPVKYSELLVAILQALGPVPERPKHSPASAESGRLGPIPALKP